MIKEDKSCISFEDIYAEFPLDVIFASALTIFQPNLKEKSKPSEEKKHVKTLQQKVLIFNPLMKFLKKINMQT